jgi:hypothetical protein
VHIVDRNQQRMAAADAGPEASQRALQLRALDRRIGKAAQRGSMRGRRFAQLVVCASEDGGKCCSGTAVRQRVEQMVRERARDAERFAGPAGGRTQDRETSRLPFECASVQQP